MQTLRVVPLKRLHNNAETRHDFIHAPAGSSRCEKNSHIRTSLSQIGYAFLIIEMEQESLDCAEH